jgi:DNA-binding Lrp family transcriptional regulator
MSASSYQRKRIEEKLPHELLKELYLNSRVSIKELERKLGISHHTLSKCLKECEEKYNLKYTLDVDTNLLGFSEPRIIAIKFQERVPDIALLKKVLGKDPFVQNAYLATGDFDLIIHIVGMDYVKYKHWEFAFRVGLSFYKPRVKTVTLNDMVEGFMPVKSTLITRAKVERINKVEKLILTKLLDNSRIRLGELAAATGVSKMRVIYAINKLVEKGIIKGFRMCVQNPDKRIFLFYAEVIIPNENHHKMSLLPFLYKVIGSKSEGQVTSDYSVVCDTTGYFDAVYFCNFKDGVCLNETGPEFLKKAWHNEYPYVEQCMLTELITGMWPFNTNSYVKWRCEMEAISKKPIKFVTYK